MGAFNKKNPVYQIDRVGAWGMKVGDRTVEKFKSKATGREEVEHMLMYMHRTRRNEIANDAKRMLRKGETRNAVSDYIDTCLLELEQTLMNPLHTLVYCSHQYMLAGNWKEAAQIAKTLAEYTHAKAPTQIVSDVTEHTYSEQDLTAKLTQLTSDLNLVKNSAKDAE